MAGGRECDYATRGDGVKVIELTSLWKELTKKQGDRELNKTLRYLGTTTDSCPFPSQTGHAKDKRMPCADGQKLKELLSGLNSTVLNEKQNFIQEVLAQLLGHDCSARVVSRFTEAKMIPGSESVKIIKSSVDVPPQFVLFTVLKMFAPACDPSSVFYHRGVCKYLEKCGVSMPNGLAHAPTGEGAAANPSWSLDDDTISDYEKKLGSKSSGLTWGRSPYNKGELALQGDLPVFVLVMMKLQTKHARQFRGQTLHQGVVMMGGNDKVALAISEHWRDQRALQPWNELLQFFGAAVEHEVASHGEPTGNAAASSSSLTERQIALLEAEESRKNAKHAAEMQKHDEEMQTLRDERAAKRVRHDEEMQTLRDERAAKRARQEVELKELRDRGDAAQKSLQIESEKKTSDHLLWKADFANTVATKVQNGELTQEQADTILGKQRRLLRECLGDIYTRLGFPGVKSKIRNFAQQTNQAYLDGKFAPKPQTDWIDGIVDVKRGSVKWYDTDEPALMSFASSLMTESSSSSSGGGGPRQTVLVFNSAC